MHMTNQELKSKVVSLGNKLAPHMGGDRKAAFIQAWVIVKAGGLKIAVKGVSFGNRQEALKRLAAYSPELVRAVLVPEPSNPADPAAIAVMVGVQGGKGLFKLGYVPASLTPAVSAIRGIHTLAFPALRVVSGTWGFSHNTTYGARLALGV
jgi:hypothetical protein